MRAETFLPTEKELTCARTERTLYVGKNGPVPLLYCCASVSISVAMLRPSGGTVSLRSRDFISLSSQSWALNVA